MVNPQGRVNRNRIFICWTAGESSEEVTIGYMSERSCIRIWAGFLGNEGRCVDKIVWWADVGGDVSVQSTHANVGKLVFTI